MPHQILQEDWSEYDNRKLRRQDRSFFACTEKWEVDYLVNKIKKHTSKTEDQIRAAITSCCGITAGSRPRTQFVECVMSKL